MQRIFVLLGILSSSLYVSAYFILFCIAFSIVFLLLLFLCFCLYSVPDRSLIAHSWTRLVRIYILRMEFLWLVFHNSCLRRGLYIIIDTQRNSSGYFAPVKVMKYRLRRLGVLFLSDKLSLVYVYANKKTSFYFRLLRIFKLKKRYRDIFGTLVLLSPLMWSTAIVMMVMYYFFAIIGMELFSEYDLRNCCV